MLTFVRDRYQCLFCDGRERSHLPMGLMGFHTPKHLAHAMMLVHMSGAENPKVTIFTQGPLPSDDPELRSAAEAAKIAGCVFESRKVVKLERAPEGEEGLDVWFDDGYKSRMGFLADKPPTVPVGEKMLVEGLGVEIASDPLGSFVKRTEPFGETSVKGCFAPGDMGTNWKQVTAAMMQGVTAAVGVSMQLCGDAAEEVLAKVKQASGKKDGD